MESWPNWIPALGINRYLEVSLCIVVSVVSFCHLLASRKGLGFTCFSQELDAFCEEAAVAGSGMDEFLFFLVSPHWNSGPVRHRSCAAGEESCEMLLPSSLGPSTGTLGSPSPPGVWWGLPHLCQI